MRCCSVDSYLQPLFSRLKMCGFEAFGVLLSMHGYAVLGLRGGWGGGSF